MSVPVVPVVIPYNIVVIKNVSKCEVVARRLSLVKGGTPLLPPNLEIVFKKLIFMVGRVHFAYKMNGTTETTKQSAKYEKDNCFSNDVLHRRFVIDGGGAVVCGTSGNDPSITSAAVHQFGLVVSVQRAAELCLRPTTGESEKVS